MLRSPVYLVDSVIPLINYNINLMCNNNNQTCSGDNVHCNSNGQCECDEGYEYKTNLNQTCVPCQEYDKIYNLCDNCCTPVRLKCSNTTICICEESYPDNCSNHGEAFVTASQIALSAALIMGIFALAMVIYRLCTKPKYLTARQRAAAAASRTRNGNGNSTRQQFGDHYNFFRWSLSSMQIRVFSRLQDRPPVYRSEVPATTNNTNTNTAAVTNSDCIEDPPPYEIDRDSPTHLPPPYVELILNPSGYINQTFEDSEQATTNESKKL